MNPEWAAQTRLRQQRQVLSEEQKARIHAGSLAVLERTGIVIDHPEALKLLAQAGARVDDATRIAKVPGKLVEACLEQAPAEFLIPGLTTLEDLPVACDGRSYGRPVLSLDWIVDAHAKRRRQVTMQDLENWVRVGDALPNLSLVSGIYPWDVSMATRDLMAARRMLELSAKPILIAAVTGATVRWMAEMMSVIPGQRPGRITVFSSSNSPLIYSESQMDVLLEAVRLGFPVMVNSSAVTGATAPMTLAGTLVVMNAEILAGITVAQLASPGARVVHCGHPVFLDMRTGAASLGYTEAGLIQAAIIEMGRYYQLPTGSNGLTTDSHACDEQAAIEKIMAGFAALMDGASFNGGAGSLAAVSTCSLEQMVIDDEIYGSIFRMAAGICVDENDLAVEVIREVGPQGQFLDHEHTFHHMRTELRYSKLVSRMNPEMWLQDGGLDMLDRAAARVKAILAQPISPIHSDHVLAELDRIVKRADHSP
jgi:trimethylamine---corrinoid protein Co-methyltransferase